MSEAITRLLHEWHNGSEDARDELWPLMYDELRRLALHQMKDQRAGHTLQATALVNEAFVKLAGVDSTATNKQQFFGLAARAMRSILIDHARARGRNKRGANAARVTLTDGVMPQTGGIESVIAVDEALQGLAQKDSRKADIVELRVFGGLTYDEIADTLGLSNSTVRAEMRFAKAWLEAEMANNR